MLQYEKDSLMQEPQSFTTEFTRADAVPANTLVMNLDKQTDPCEAPPDDKTVRHVRALALRQAVLQDTWSGAHTLSDGKPDELLLSSGFLARRARQAALHGGSESWVPRAEVVASIVTVAHHNLPAHCGAKPEMLREIKLATYLHYACQDASSNMEVSQSTAENLLQSYAYSDTDVVMRAVRALNRMSQAEARGIKAGVERGGLAFAAVMAAKTHYNLVVGSDPIYGDEECGELTRKRAAYNAKLETMHELLHESEGFESSAARWLMHRIFSSSPVELNRYLHQFGPEPVV